MYQISFYVPKEEAETVKNAMFDVGAGKVCAKYAHCAWQTEGVGQFTPIGNAEPVIGELNKPETVEEYKVEMLCTGAKLDAALKAMELAHSYQTVVYAVVKLEDV